MALRTDVGSELRAVVKARRKARHLRRRIIGIGILAALAIAALGSIGHAEARVPPDNPRTDGLAHYCGELQDRYDYDKAQYEARKAANPNDPSLDHYLGEMQTLEYKWQGPCSATFGSIKCFNAILCDIAINTSNLTVLQSDTDGGSPPVLDPALMQRRGAVAR
jgi:hypothetical protein